MTADQIADAIMALKVDDLNRLRQRLRDLGLDDDDGPLAPVPSPSPAPQGIAPDYADSAE